MTDASHSDGSVIIRVNVNAAEADKELVRLTKKINALNERISDKKQDQMPLVEQSKQLAAVLDDAKAKLDYMKSGDTFFTSSSIKEQEQTVPDWLGGFEFKGINIPRLDKIKLPRLATGTVIPPNREFLAVLGDQKQGNNIEAPESAIEAAVARGMAQYGGGNQTAILKIGEQELGRIIFKLNKDQTQRVGIKVT